MGFCFVQKSMTFNDPEQSKRMHCKQVQAANDLLSFFLSKNNKETNSQSDKVLSWKYSRPILQNRDHKYQDQDQDRIKLVSRLGFRGLSLKKSWFWSNA